MSKSAPLDAFHDTITRALLDVASLLDVSFARDFVTTSKDFASSKTETTPPADASPNRAEFPEMRQPDTAPEAASFLQTSSAGVLSPSGGADGDGVVGDDEDAPIADGTLCTEGEGGGGDSPAPGFESAAGSFEQPLHAEHAKSTPRHAWSMRDFGESSGDRAFMDGGERSVLRLPERPDSVSRGRGEDSPISPFVSNGLDRRRAVH